MPDALSLLTPSDRRNIVREYLAQLNDETLLIVCKLYTLGRTDDDVCKALRIKPAMLADIKKTIGDGILKVMRGDK